ncbi:MAG: hypothetical protein QOI20_3252 [Acidimicrobiaceae bacterium]|nr:hypothetical protein [Acidimicrobiaceae bacterium]
MAAVAPQSPIVIARQELAKLSSQLDVTVAERDGALDALRGVVRILDSIGGYMTPEHQRALRIAKAVLAESGRLG